MINCSFIDNRRSQSMTEQEKTTAAAAVKCNVMPPSAIAGNRVNRECYMQVRGYGCTTPALVPFCVARL